MGQQCSHFACRHVERRPESIELSRADSPDPVMYDLMRKSIQATAITTQQQQQTQKQQDYPLVHHHASASATATTPQTPQPSSLSSSSRRRKHPGQHHLMFRNTRTGSMSSVSSSSDPYLNYPGDTGALGKGMHSNYNGPMPPPGAWLPDETPVECPTRLLIRRRPRISFDHDGSISHHYHNSNPIVTTYSSSTTSTFGTHIYAIRCPEDTPKRMLSEQAMPAVPPTRQEQCPPSSSKKKQQQQRDRHRGKSHTATKNKSSSTTARSSKQRKQSSKKTSHSKSYKNHDDSSWSNPNPLLLAPSSSDSCDIFTSTAMASIPRQPVLDWVTVSDEHNIYVADVGLTAGQCDHIIGVTEQVCRGQYAAYTYAKQTLGCREYPILARTSFLPVHTAVHSIISKFTTTHQKPGDEDDDDDNGTPRTSTPLQLDDREPHIVKYDVTRKERQKLDMHTDKSEWTFLIALSNGCGVDYEGGGTFFECLGATVHIQRGHALIFPGKLRHCGQKITNGLRFLLVGFLVDKSSNSTTTPSTSSPSSTLPQSLSAMLASSSSVSSSGEDPPCSHA